MRFSMTSDVDCPGIDLFDSIADFDRLEQILAGRGTQVERLDPGTDGPLTWNLRFNWHGKTRDMRVRVVRFDRPHLVELHGEVEQMVILLTVRVTALTRDSSRLALAADVTAQSIRARLILQTAKLARTRLEERFARHADRFVAQVMA